MNVTMTKNFSLGAVSSPERYQRGGFFLGMIIGLLIGLAAALAVALYVAKVPVPFLNKGVTKNGSEQDAQEAQKNKNWDPNAPLYGKNPAKPNPTALPSASGAVGTAPEPQPAAKAMQSTSVPKSTSSTQAATPPAAKPSSDPLGDLAKAKTAAADNAAATKPSAAQTAANNVDPFTYFVQAGAFRTAEDAEAQRAKLTIAGFEAKVTEREQSGRTVFRVRVGPMDKRGDAANTKEKLDGAGFETAIVRIQR